MIEQSQNSSAKSKIEANVKAALFKEGIKGKWVKSPSGSDVSWIIEEKNGEKVAVEIKHLSPLRYSQLDAQMALGLLQLHQERRLDQLILILVVPELNERLKANVSTFVERYSEILKNKIDWFILSESDQYFGSIRNHQCAGWIEESKTNSRSLLDFYIEGSSKSSQLQRSRPVGFSGNHQWMLKYLLLDRINSKFWGEEPQIGPWNSNTLKERAGFRTASQAHSLLLELEENGYLVRTNGRTEFRDLKKLFEEWTNAYKKEKHVMIPLAPLIPNESFEAWRDGSWKSFESAAKASNSQILVGGHFACFGYGVGWSNNPSILIHALAAQTQSVEKFLRAMKLKVTDNKNSPIQLQLHKSPKPVLDIHGDHRENHSMLVDIIQCVLDVHLLGGRGEEQAEHIFKEVLYPHFKEMGWSL